jgi:hypothetical protein
MNHLSPDFQRGLRTLAEERDEFTNEGAPPPVEASSDFDGRDAPPSSPRRPILSLRPSALLERQAKAASLARS